MNNFKLRRERLLQALPDHSLVILSSGKLIKQSEDAFYDFFVMPALAAEGDIVT